MKFNLTELGKNLGQDILQDFSTDFFCGAVKVFELILEKNEGRKKALEGNESETFEAKFNSLINEYCEEFQKVDVYYSEEEIRKLFEQNYNNFSCCGQHLPDNETNKEELYKRYRIFVMDYVKKFSKTITYGEKRILEKTDLILDKLKNNTLTSEYFKQASKNQIELINKLCKDIDLPFLEISNSMDTGICSYHSRFAFYGNVFDFNRNTSDDRDNMYVLSLIIKNIGRTIMNEVEISNFRMTFCKEIEDDNPETGYHILPAMLEEGKEQCVLNLLPNSEQKIHIVTRRRENELNDNDICDMFLAGDEVLYVSPFEYDRFLAELDLLVVGNSKTNSYRVSMFLAKNPDSEVHKEEKDIVGKLTIDYVGMQIMDQSL